ncbi:unnamed protein product [Discula destructiva]
MPPAVSKGGTELRIELDNVGRAHQPCQPGSIITGRVVRTAPGVSPRATVSIRLRGRAKTRITVTRSNGQSTTHSHYRNRFNFFEPTQTRQFLFDGPLHIAPGAAGEPASWPFAIDVPTTASLQALRSEAGQGNTHWLSLTPGDVILVPLPGSFYTEGHHRNTKFEAYVEYHLEAMLMTLGSHGKDVTAVLPIQMSAAPRRHPVSDFEIHRRSLQGLVSTYRLVPELQNADLSFKQKTKQLLGSSKVPMFGYTLQVDCPAVIQLGNPKPIPFSMRIVPDQRRTSEDIHEVDQTVALTSLELVLKAHTAVIAPRTFGKQESHDTVKHHISLPVVGLGEIINPTIDTETPPPDAKGAVQSLPSAQPQKPFGLVLPSKRQVGDETALDIGSRMGFTLNSKDATALSRSIASTCGLVTPDFKTYCIRHDHTLKWKVVLEIAGKTMKHESEQTVTIVGPSEEPLPPPPPPSAAGQKGEEELPSYGASAQVGGPSNTGGVADAPVEELPSYSK